jgi:diguanylate cyclase (GGDEF)-like protein/PAS domain S-box-containing protein
VVILNPKYTIGILSSFLGGNYLGELTNTIQDAVNSYGGRLIAIRTAGMKFDLPIAVDHVDGWIVINDAVTDAYIQYLQLELKKPVVVISRDITAIIPDGYSVVCDNIGGIQAAFDHLIEHGHRSIGFVGHIRPTSHDLKMRLKGYHEALKKHNIPFNSENVIDPGEISILGGHKAADHLVNAGFPFKAAVVCTDLNAFGMLERLTELGYRVPEDFALIGFDNSLTTRSSKPGLSSIDQNIKGSGFQAVELLYKQFEQIPIYQHNFIVKSNLVLRGSCGCVEEMKPEFPSEYAPSTIITKEYFEHQLGVSYEFNKFIMKYKFDEIKDLSWILSSHFEWGCLGLWTQDDQYLRKLDVSQFYHFRDDYELTKAMKVDVEKFPPLELSTRGKSKEVSDMVYLIPFRGSENNWSVLAMGASLADSNDQQHNHTSIIQYLDLMASALEHQALLKELKEQGQQFMHIAEQLEVVSRTSNDGIWDWNLQTGFVEWNQRLYQLLQTSDARRFEILIHPDDLQAYTASLNAHLLDNVPFEMEFRLCRNDGFYVWVIASGEALRNQDGLPIRIIGSVRNISERKQSEETMRYMAYHDSLTGLSNRVRFSETIFNAIIHSPDQNFAVMVFDLDQFKKVNDSYGHDTGDLVLKYVASKVGDLVLEKDHMGRFGGDEFVLLYPYNHSYEVEEFASEIAYQLSVPIIQNGVHIITTTSIGISTYPKDGADSETLIKKADIAMFKAKQGGKNKYEIFSTDMIEQTMWRINTENKLQAALSNEEFILYYQPQVDLLTGELFGIEALLRWDSPLEGVIAPGEFIELAEETGLIVPIGEWVILDACRQMNIWRDKGYKPVLVSVNISGHQLKQRGFVDKIKAIIQHTGVDPQFLCFEMTESTIIDDLEATIRMFHEFAELGIKLSLDDFGTGYSSLSILKKLPINMLKIDKSFIGEITLEQSSRDIIKGIIFISKSLQLRVVAEGIEQEEQYAVLQELECDYLQGFYISHPLPAKQVESFMLMNTAQTNHL